MANYLDDTLVYARRYCILLWIYVSSIRNYLLTGPNEEVNLRFLR